MSNVVTQKFGAAGPEFSRVRARRPRHPAKAFRQRIRMTHKERPKTLSVCLTAPRLLPPHPAQTGDNIGGSPIPRGSVSNFDPLGPAPSIEGAHNPVRDESAAARINVLIANLTLVKRVKPLRNDEVQFRAPENLLLFGHSSTEIPVRVAP